MVTNQIRPKTTPGRATRGQLTYVAIAAMVVFVVLLAAAVIRPVLRSATPPQGAPPATTQPSAPASPASSG